MIFCFIEVKKELEKKKRINELLLQGINIEEYQNVKAQLYKIVTKYFPKMKNYEEKIEENLQKIYLFRSKNNFETEETKTEEKKEENPKSAVFGGLNFGNKPKGFTLSGFGAKAEEKKEETKTEETKQETKFEQKNKLQPIGIFKAQTKSQEIKQGIKLQTNKVERTINCSNITKAQSKKKMKIEILETFIKIIFFRPELITIIQPFLSTYNICMEDIPKFYRNSKFLKYFTKYKIEIENTSNTKEGKIIASESEKTLPEEEKKQ